MLRLSFAAFFVVAGCASSRTVPPVVTTLAYVTTVPAPAALDSVRVWAEAVPGLAVDLAGSSLAIADARQASPGRTIVDAVSRADGVTQVTMRTEHAPGGSQPVAVAWYEHIHQRPEVLFLPSDGSGSVCFSVADWRNRLARRAEPREPAGKPVEIDERPPKLIGGLAGLDVQYPESLRRAGVEGKVVVRFVVDEAGAVECAEPILSSHPELSQAALAAVRGAQFVPGMQRGEAVRVRFSLPLTFRLL